MSIARAGQRLLQRLIRRTRRALTTGPPLNAANIPFSSLAPASCPMTPVAGQLCGVSPTLLRAGRCLYLAVRLPSAGSATTADRARTIPRSTTPAHFDPYTTALTCDTLRQLRAKAIPSLCVCTLVLHAGSGAHMRLLGPTHFSCSAPGLSHRGRPYAPVTKGMWPSALVASGEGFDPAILTRSHSRKLRLRGQSRVACSETSSEVAIVLVN